MSRMGGPGRADGQLTEDQETQEQGERKGDIHLFAAGLVVVKR